ncbi:20328_t:CDS:2 [Entrophospora sp. SA101]|nr:9660_t:CDS:2 [Entrophospora sp. SA101]CAJ0753699.1 6304_t:CDS:2 [Entrophospora sp. SA101]CAJ0760315.1 4678_t:CDS:2 [Entrophospora sp. SA101]CAJ0764681.1 20328_t:CDS:2 [Entrophospora sp. SA101]
MSISISFISSFHDNFLFLFLVVSSSSSCRRKAKTMHVLIGADM